VKVLWTLEAEPLHEARSRFATETRAVGTDAQAQAKFRDYWRRFGGGAMVIRWLLLTAVRRTAERRWRADRAGTIG
jgi:GTP cyclohydrolase II